MDDSAEAIASDAHRTFAESIFPELEQRSKERGQKRQKQQAQK